MVEGHQSECMFNSCSSEGPGIQFFRIGECDKISRSIKPFNVNWKFILHTLRFMWNKDTRMNFDETNYKLK